MPPAAPAAAAPGGPTGGISLRGLTKQFQIQRETVTALDRVRTIESLYAFSRKLAGTATLDDVLWATAYQTALTTNQPIAPLGWTRRHSTS